MDDAGQAIKARFDAALACFTDKLRGDPNVLAVVLWGSLANDTVWEKSDMDISVLVRDIKLAATGFCVEEDGLILNVDVQKEFEFKRSLERSLGGGFLHSAYSQAKIVYAADDSLNEFLAGVQKMGADDRDLAFFHSAAFLIGDMEKIEKWLTVKRDPLYAQFWVLKAVDVYANMRLLLDGKPLSREAVLKVMAYAPDSIRHLYETPMRGHMGEAEIRDALAFFRAFLEGNLDTVRQPVKHYMSDGEVRTVTTLVKHFRLDSHAIYHVFDFLAEMDVVARVTEPARITPKSRRSIEEVAFMYVEGFAEEYISGHSEATLGAASRCPDKVSNGREPMW